MQASVALLAPLAPDLRHLLKLKYILLWANRIERERASFTALVVGKHLIDDAADIVCVERLGGLLKSYHRLAA